jgi:hypothetical protein
MGQAYFRYIKRFQYPDHLFFFSTANLHTLLEQSGFKLEAIYRYSIMPQMRFINALMALKSVVSRPPAAALPEPAGAPAPKPAGHQAAKTNKDSGVSAAVKQGLRNGFHYLVYLLRYQLGRLMVRADQPQTVVVIARRLS